MPGKIHVRTWSAAQNARLTEMENAGKRGKKCRILRIQGSGWQWGDKADNTAGRATDQIMRLLSDATGVGLNEPVNGVVDGDFDAVISHVKKVVAEARANGAQEWQIAAYDEEIRGVDAPRPLLSAGNDKVSVTADEGGLMLTDQTDNFNLPAMCTIRQSEQQAYQYAAKVWPQVEAAIAAGANMHGVSDVLSGAGCKLHYWCRMD